MKWLLIIFLLLLLLILLIAFTRLTVFINVNHSQDNDDIKIKFSIWFGLIKYTIKVPMVKVDDDSPSVVIKKENQSNIKKDTKPKKKKFSIHEVLASMHDTKTIIDRVIGMTSIIKEFLAKITISKFEWHSHIGVGDAAHTGVLAGIGWSIKGTLVGMISHNMKLKTHPEYSITPSFQRAVSETKLICMFHFRIGHAMVAGIKLIKKWNGGLPKFKSPILSKLNGTNSDKKSV